MSSDFTIKPEERCFCQKCRREIMSSENSAAWDDEVYSEKAKKEKMLECSACNAVTKVTLDTWTEPATYHEINNTCNK